MQALLVTVTELVHKNCHCNWIATLADYFGSLGQCSILFLFQFSIFDLLQFWYSTGNRDGTRIFLRLHQPLQVILKNNTGMVEKPGPRGCVNSRSGFF